MKHGYFGRKLSRTNNERRRLFMVLIRDLVTKGSIRTTLAKAKAVQPLVDSVITSVKKGTNASLSHARKVLADEKVLSVLTDMTKTRFAKRTSGYTRIIRLGLRRGDAAEAVQFEFVDPAPVAAEVVKTKKIAEAPKKVEEAAVVSKKPVKKTVKSKK